MMPPTNVSSAAQIPLDDEDRRESIHVRVVTRVYAEEVVVQGGKYQGVNELDDDPQILVRYPAGDMAFDALDGKNASGTWWIHPEDLRHVQRSLPVRIAHERWSVRDDDHQVLLGVHLLPKEELRHPEAGPRVLVVTLAPTQHDDPHASRLMRRLLRIASREKWSTLQLCHLFSVVLYEEPTTKALLATKTPIRSDLDDAIARAATTSDLVVAAWGSSVTFGRRQPTPIRGRDERVVALIRASGHDVIYAFGEEGGTPARRPKEPPHPLHVPASATLVPWRTATKATDVQPANDANG